MGREGRKRGNDEKKGRKKERGRKRLENFWQGKGKQAEDRRKEGSKGRIEELNLLRDNVGAK